MADLVSSALAAADPRLLVTSALARAPADDRRLVSVLAAGKAAPAMAAAFLHASARPVTRGLVIGTGTDPNLDGPLRWMSSSHPVPDARSVEAGRAALDLAAAVGRNERLVVLLSGGASALMAVPAGGLPLEVKQAVTRRLLGAGASIGALNAVRKHLSAIKGGALAARVAGDVLTLALSDVVGDDPSVIGSGPTVGDPSTFGEALAVVDRCGGRAAYPRDAVARLEAGARGDIPETPKPCDAVFRRGTYRVIGSARDAVRGASHRARTLGFDTLIVPNPVAGEARVAARAWAAQVSAIARGRAGRVCVVSAGETTVDVKGTGRGGRNQEFALALVPALAGLGRAVVVASLGTDGVDGPTDAAGAIADTDTAARAAARGLDPLRYLEANDAWSFFEALDDLVRTGPTGTNVGDLQIALVDG